MMYNVHSVAAKVASAALYVNLFHLASTHPQSENARVGEISSGPFVQDSPLLSRSSIDTCPGSDLHEVQRTSYIRSHCPGLLQASSLVAAPLDLPLDVERSNKLLFASRSSSSSPKQGAEKLC
jgi:hypothetical protein